MDQFRKKATLFIEPNVSIVHEKTSRKGDAYTQTKSLGTVFLTAPAKTTDAVTAALLNKAKVGVVTITSTSEPDAPCPFQQHATNVGCFVDSAQFERVTEQKYYTFTKEQLQDNAFIKNVRKKTFLNGKQYATGKFIFFKAKGTSIPKKMKQIITKKTGEALQSIKMTLNTTVKFL